MAKRLTKRQKEKKLEKIEILRKQIAEYKEAIEVAKEANPFVFFEPSDGTIPPDRMGLLNEFLKEDDLPSGKLDSQLDCVLSEANIIGASGGNRAGKSAISAIKGAIKSTGELPKALKEYEHTPSIARDLDRFKRRFAKGQPILGRVIGVDFKQLSNTVIPTWQKWIPKEYLLNGKWKDSFSAQHSTLSLFKDNICCAKIEFMTNQMDATSFQGPDLDWVMYDEEPKLSIYKENNYRFGTSEYLDVGIYWTPTQGLTWATDLFHNSGLFDDEEEGVETNVELFKLCSVTNKKVNVGVLRSILQDAMSYEEIRMRLLGEAISLSGLVYGRLFTKEHIIEPFIEDYHSKHEYLCITGMDPHLVTPSAMVFLLVDRENNWYIDRCHSDDGDTEQMKEHWHEIVKTNGYRTGWAVADKSSNSSIMAFGGRNIFRELSMGANAIPALRTSEKYEGSIKAGVDEIKKRLRNKTLFIVNRKENKDLIQSFRTLERETYANEELNGPKDRIREGKHHFHAAFRYISQYPCSWYGEVIQAPEPEFYDEAAQY
ncbi:MAG: hypothetical protein V3R78_10110 [Thermodesulfobacteriota bacterium]